MRIWNLTLGLAAFLLASLGILNAADDNEITWLGNYHEALQLAKQTHRPLFVEFRCEA